MMSQSELIDKFSRLMYKLDDLNENNLNQFEQDAIISLINDGEITLTNINNYGISPKELSVFK